MSDWNTKIIEEFRAKGGKGVTNFDDRLLLLTARGAKSGTARTTPLAFHIDGDRYVVAASMGGAPKHPAWYHNLVARGEAELEVGPERDRLFDEHARLMPGFREYTTRTTRIIPIVVLERLEQQQAA